MYLDEPCFPGGGHFGPTCRSCKAPITEGQRTKRIAFDHDPNGEKGLSGDYHDACSKPFASLARAINMLGRLGR